MNRRGCSLDTLEMFDDTSALSMMHSPQLQLMHYFLYVPSGAVQPVANAFHTVANCHIVEGLHSSVYYQSFVNIVRPALVLVTIDWMMKTTMQQL